jgi:hypothetical protein
MSLSLSAATITLLFGTAVAMSDTGKELAQLDTPLFAISEEFDITALESDSAAAVCRAETELTLRPLQDDPELSSQSACAPRSEPEIQVATLPPATCVPYGWGSCASTHGSTATSSTGAGTPATRIPRDGDCQPMGVKGSGSGPGRCQDVSGSRFPSTAGKKRLVSITGAEQATQLDMAQSTSWHRAGRTRPASCRTPPSAGP